MRRWPGRPAAPAPLRFPRHGAQEVLGQATLQQGGQPVNLFNLYRPLQGGACKQPEAYESGVHSTVGTTRTPLYVIKPCTPSCVDGWSTTDLHLLTG